MQQTPILAQLQNQVDVVVHKLDAIEQEALARFYGIMTVPTTVGLVSHLHPVAVNHGVAPLQKLQAQIGSAAQPAGELRTTGVDYIHPFATFNPVNHEEIAKRVDRHVRQQNGR